MGSISTLSVVLVLSHGPMLKQPLLTKDLLSLRTRPERYAKSKTSSDTCQEGEMLIKWKEMRVLATRQPQVESSRGFNKTLIGVRQQSLLHQARKQATPGSLYSQYINFAGLDTYPFVRRSTW